MQFVSASGGHRRGGRKNERDEGAVAVEFLLVSPILFLLVFGIINFGALFTQQLALNNGVRQGVRLAVVAGNTANQTCGQVVTSVQSASVPAIGMPQQGIEVQVQRVSSTDASDVKANCYPLNNGTDGFVKTPGTNTTRVCADNASTANSIKATARFKTKYVAVMPFLPSPQFTLKATAVYRCEFTS